MSVAAAACVEDPDYVSTEQAVTQTYLLADVTVASDKQNVELTPGVAQTFTIDAGAAVYLYARSTVGELDTVDDVSLDKMVIDCGTGGAITTTTNQVTSAAQAQYGRMLLVAPATGGPYTYTCTLRGAIWPGTDRITTHVRTFQGGSTYTWMQRSATLTACGTDHLCRRWGTENDGVSIESYPAVAQDGIYVGPGSQFLSGSSEYILRSNRFSIPPSVYTFSVYAEPEITACYERTDSCPCGPQSSSCPLGLAGNPDYTQGDYIGTTVSLRLVIQQMCAGSGPDSSIVGKTTYYPATSGQQFSIGYEEHHKKAHVATSNVPVYSGPNSCSACPSHACVDNSFILKSQITYVSDAPAKVELGTGGSSGYSTMFVFGG